MSLCEDVTLADSLSDFDMLNDCVPDNDAVRLGVVEELLEAEVDSLKLKDSVSL